MTSVTSVKWIAKKKNPKNTEVDSFFSKVWVFAAARNIFSGHTHWAVHVQTLLWKFLFWEILQEDFKEDSSVFLTAVQMKPEKLKTAEKEPKHRKSFQNKLNSYYIPFPLLFGTLLTADFPYGAARVGESPSEASLSRGRAAKSGYGTRAVPDLWPVPRLGQPEKLIGMEHMAFDQCGKPSLSVGRVPVLIEWKIRYF